MKICLLNVYSANYQPLVDIRGQGDFLLHMPGWGLQDKLRVFPGYLEKVVG